MHTIVLGGGHDYNPSFTVKEKIGTEKVNNLSILKLIS